LVEVKVGQRQRAISNLRIDRDGNDDERAARREETAMMMNGRRIQSVTLTLIPLTKNSVHENRSRRGCGYGEGEGGFPETK
jgi:hypothetical protein